MAQNANLNHWIESSFQGVNRLFVLALGNDAQRISNKRYYVPNVEIKHTMFTFNIINRFNFCLYKMTLYNSQLNKLKSAIKNETEVV